MDKSMRFVDDEADKMKLKTTEEREAYVKAYRAARKTKKGSSKALYGGKYSHESAMKAAKELSK